MATIAKLEVLLGLDDSKFTRNLESSRKKLDAWGSSLRGIGTKLTAGVTAPIVGSGIAVTKWAADLEQTMGATEQLWGKNADAVIKWSESSATSMGMTQDQALTSANRFNALFGQIGAGEDVTRDMSQGFTQLSADLSAMWGGNPAEASEALTSALRGNYEGLDQYGINLTEAMVSQEALTIAQAEGRSEITEGDKVQARHNLIMEQSTDSQGQFAREAETTSGALAINTARAKDAATAFGKLLLPYVNKLLAGFSKMVSWIENLNDTQRKWILGIAAVAAAMGPVLLVIGMLLPGLGALLGVLGFLLSPIGLVVVAVGLLAAGLIYAYTHFESFRNIVDTVASTIKDVAVAAFDMLVDSFNKLKDAFDAGGFSQMFSTLGSMLLNGFIQLGSLAIQGVQALATAFINAAPGLLSAGWSMIQGLWDGAVGKWNEFTGWLGGRAADALVWIGDLLLTLWQKGSDLLQGFWDGVTAKWIAVSTWFINLGTMVFNAVADTLATLKSRGTDILQGFWDGVLDKWTTVSLWFVNLGTMVFGAIADVSTKIKSKGTDILQGFWQGVLDKWVAVSTWFVGLGSMIVGAVGDLSGILVGIGSSIINGLWSGMQSAWDEGKGWVTGLGGWIKDNKGPKRVDQKLLTPAGIWIMQGLSKGLASEWVSVSRQLRSYTPAIEGAISDVSLSARMPDVNHLEARNGSGTTNQYFFALRSADLVDLLAKAENGDSFAKGFAPELGMMEGVG